MALGHGLQDAQKTMGVIFLALVTGGYVDAGRRPPGLGDRRGRAGASRSAPTPVAGASCGRSAAGSSTSTRPRASPPRRSAAVGPVHHGVRVPGADLHHAHHHLGGHGRRRDQAALRGALGRRQEHHPAAGSSPSRRPAWSPRSSTGRAQVRLPAALTGLPDCERAVSPVRHGPSRCPWRRAVGPAMRTAPPSVMTRDGLGQVSRSGRRCSPRWPARRGWRRSCAVGFISTSWPGLPTPARLKNAVSSETRAACCMLCVTMTIV